MSLSDRVSRLREHSLNTPATLSGERARLMTEFYHQDIGTVSTPVYRALAFQYLMDKKKIFIGEGELIVGERGPAPKATPTFPEICCHTMDDLEVLNSRDKISFNVTDEVRELHRDHVIPYWSGRSLRDLIFAEMTDEWKAAYKAGIFTEFMEQRAPGHTVLDDKIYQKGFLDFKQDITASMDSLDFLNDPNAYDKQEQLKAMSICAYALIHYAYRHAQVARSVAQTESDPRRRGELLRIAEVCRRVPGNPPRDFWEALQYYWFVHVGVITELNTWDSFNPGRLDQHLYPFYEKGLANGSLTRDRARELLQCFWIKFNNHPAPPKVGVTAE
ncbi:MAG: pyruvate formate lyase family protein, partial [Gemmatimonadales bacterium]